MQIIDYRHFDKSRRVSWERRYRKFAPRFALGYCILLFAVLLEGINLADEPAHFSPVFDFCFEVLGFPAFILYDATKAKGLLNFALASAGMCNAAIWSFFYCKPMACNFPR